MAEQLSGSGIRRVLRTVAGIFRPARGPGYMIMEEPELTTCRGKELVVFEALPGIRRRSEPQQSACTEQEEATVADSHSQGPVPSGGERLLDRAPSEQSLSSDDFLPYGARRRIAKCCNEKKSCCCLLAGFACVVVALLALLITLSLLSRPAPVTPLPTPSWLPWRNRTEDNGLPRLLLWNPGESGQSSSHTSAAGDDDHSFFNTIVCKVNGSSHPEVCEITKNRHRLMRSDAIVFYPDNLDINDAPPQRAVDQLWVFWSRQRQPPLSKGTIDSPSLSLPVVARVFNWTMAKREDADVVIPHETFRCQESGDKPQAKPLDRKDNAVALPPKSDVAWILGECEEERFFTEIRSFRPSKNKAGRAVHLHLFPACGATLCETTGECVRYIAERFHFVVVTLLPECFQTAYDVIYEAFKYDLIPIVLTKGKGTLNVPKSSVITSRKQH
ncbi:hypothetical protein V5799_011616, partial [Amblyomma americanum]